MSDPLDELRDLAPTVDDRPELLEHVRNDLLTIIERDIRNKAGQPAEMQPHRAKRRWAIPIAAALVATTAAAAYAFTLSSSDSTAVECPTGIYDAVTGDPVVDCSNEWRRANSAEPPAMTAYDNGSGGVTVLLADDPIPDGYTVLEPGPFQNSSLIELEASLDDYGTGLSSGCYDELAAREIIQPDLDRLGLTGWTITVDTSHLADGTNLCAAAIVVPEAQQVQVIGLSNDAAASDPYARFAADLNERLSAECIGNDEAASLTRTRAAVPFYGPGPSDPDFSGSSNAAVLGIYAELDDRVNASRDAMDAALTDAGLTHDIQTFPGVNHAFFNETGERHDPTQAAAAFDAALSWFAANLA